MKTILILPPEESQILLEWCHNQVLTQEKFSGRDTCRKEKWFGIQAELYFSHTKLFPHIPIESDSFLDDYRKRFSPDSDSILLYRYEVGGEIGSHLDKKCFDKVVTLVNLIDSDPDLFGNRDPIRFKWNSADYYLRHGEVVQFDSRVEHSVPKLKSARYSLQFRKVISQL